jgi:hypothetical protein
MSTHAFIVLERRGTLWVLPRRVAEQRSGAPHSNNAHVPFVYVNDPDGTPQLSSDEVAKQRVESAIRWAANGIVDGGRRYLVIDVLSGEVIDTHRPPQPATQFRVGELEQDDLLPADAKRTED